MTFSRATNLLRRYCHPLLLAGMLLLILGMRIYVGVRCLAEIPQMDDSTAISWLQKWSHGVHDWSVVWTLHNGAHPMELFYLANLVQYRLNGFWDGRLDFLVSAFVHTAYAAVAFWTFGHLLARRDRAWIYLFLLVLFALPFGGYRVGWGLLWPFSAMMVFTLPAVYLAAYRRQSWRTVIAICLLSALAAINFGAGCLCALSIVGLTLFEAALARRITSRDVAVSAGCLVIFLTVYRHIHSDKPAGSLAELIGAFLKSLAWPAVFVPGAGLLTIATLAAFVTVQIIRPPFRGKNVSFVTGIFGLSFLISAATGAMRGDNNNMGMPSGRNIDLYLLMPLVTAVALCLLYRASSGGWRTACAFLACAWLGCQFLGFATQVVYRIVPFMAQETGEWNEAQKQVLYRQVVRGETPIESFASNDEETLALPAALLETLTARQPPPAMTTPMITGFDLQPGSQGNYAVNGFHPSYQGRPTRLYRGSFDRRNQSAADKWFVSGSFRPQADYLTLDVVVDKKSRFTNYRLDGLRLTLLDETSGSRQELLPRLSHTFPFVLRDWEMIYAKVVPGHDYRIESSDRSPTEWLAFSEPLESGRLTPLTVGLCQSGKLLCLAGLGLLMLALYLRWLENARDTSRNAVCT